MEVCISNLSQKAIGRLEDAVGQSGVDRKKIRGVVIECQGEIGHAVSILATCTCHQNGSLPLWADQKNVHVTGKGMAETLERNGRFLHHQP